VVEKNHGVWPVLENLKQTIASMEAQVKYQYNLDYNPREIVGDNYNDSREFGYGNNNVAGPDASHGSHVAGIIGASRGNGIGLDGVADNVKIMAIRVVPDGDERDKDVANGIRYAVDNGANIINMSFGKGYKWDKDVVNEAILYAQDHNVLLVHAAGNSSQDNDVTPNYPNDSLGGDVVANNWIEVGASQPLKKKLATDFSNYGQNNVDVFAPGQSIYSTIPNNGYAYFNGTSMASPVCAGVCALVWSRNPSLTAKDVKMIMEASVELVPGKVVLPGTKKTKVSFPTLSRTGGLINAERALNMGTLTLMVK
jgi:subtilisin family serine protease